MYCPLPEDDDADITREFNESYEFLERARRGTRTKALVHCKLGITRSVSIIVHYVMRQCRYTLQQSYDFVVQQKPNIMLTPGLLAQLANREAVLYKRRIFDLRVFQSKLEQSMTPSQLRAVRELQAINASAAGRANAKEPSSVPIIIWAILIITFLIITIWTLKALRIL
jgi:hypothetical protein